MMDIRFISSLTPEDETRIAAAVCAAASSLLDHLQIAYTIRIETTDGQLFHHSNAPAFALARGPHTAPAV